MTPPVRPADRLEEPPPHDHLAGPSAAGGYPLRTPVEAARFLIGQRRRRDAVLGAALFADPAWDMLLELFVAEAEARLVTAADLRAATAAPGATALRWVEHLEGAGLLRAAPHDADPAARAVALTPRARAAVTRVLTYGEVVPFRRG